jgi:hypothetical protein
MSSSLLTFSLRMLQPEMFKNIANISSDFTFEGFVILEKMIQISEQRTSQSLRAHMDNAEQKIGEHIKSSEHNVASNIQRLEKSVSTQMRQDTLTVTNSLTMNMDQNFTYLAHSTSSRMQEIEHTVAQTQLSLNHDVNVGRQSIIEELQEIKQLLYTGCNSISLQHSADLTLRSGLIRPRTRRRRKQSTVASQISEMCTCNALKLTSTIVLKRSRLKRRQRNTHIYTWGSSLHVLSLKSMGVTRFSAFRAPLGNMRNFILTVLSVHVRVVITDFNPSKMR